MRNTVQQTVRRTVRVRLVAFVSYQRIAFDVGGAHDR